MMNETARNMGRNQTNIALKLKLVLFVVAICLVGSPSTTNKTQVRGHSLGILPVEDESLVAMVKDGQQPAVHSSSDPNAASDRTADTHNSDGSARRKPPSGGDSAMPIDGENSNPQSSKAKVKWIFGANRPNVKKMSVTARLQLLTNSQTAKQETLKFQQRGAVLSDQSERPFVELLQGRNAREVTTNNLSEKPNPGKRKNPSRRRRQSHPETSSQVGTTVTDFSSTLVIHQTQSQTDANLTSSETGEMTTVGPTPTSSTEPLANTNPPTAPPATNTFLPSTDKPDTTPTVATSSPVSSTFSEMSSPFPDATSSQHTSEPASPVTSQPSFSSIAPETSKAYPEASQSFEPSTETSRKLKPVKATPKITTLPVTPTSAPEHISTDYRTTARLDSGSSSQRNGASLLPVTNGSALPGSKIQEVKERTSGSECANSNCDPALVPANQWTDDAYWAFGSLLTILLLLTAGVLYTGLWRKRNYMSNPISDVNCHAVASPSRKGKTDIKDLLKKKLQHIKSLNSSPLSSGKSHASKHNSFTSNGRASSRHPHRYDRLPLLVGDEEEEEEEEFSKEWGPRTKEHSV